MGKQSWVTPQYSRSEVDRAGFKISSDACEIFEVTRAYEVLSNWRGAHAFPLNTFQVGLRRQAVRVDSKAIVAQRLKRVPSIIDKLQRLSSMKLSRMQDIAGCRAVVRKVSDVYALHGAYQECKQKHHWVSAKDYIEHPKDSGYRGVHVVFKFSSKGAPEFNGLAIEMQLRSQLQHAWATAVETAGVFLGHALKSSRGDERWLEFFAGASSLFAEREGTPYVPQTSTGSTLRGDVRRLFLWLDVKQTLRAFTVAIDAIDKGKAAAHYYLLHLKPAQNKIELTMFGASELARASSVYSQMERSLDEDSPDQVVLVKADSIEALRRAYPNYFADTSYFLSELSQIGIE